MGVEVRTRCENIRETGAEWHLRPHFAQHLHGIDARQCGTSGEKVCAIRTLNLTTSTKCATISGAYDDFTEFRLLPVLMRDGLAIRQS